MNSKEFVYVSFSSDSRFVIAISNQPDYVGIVWDWYKDKLIARSLLETKITKITINPRDNQ